MPVTDTVKPTADYVSITAARLAVLAEEEPALPWMVFSFFGTSNDQLWNVMPGMLTTANGLPVAVVMYGGSKYADFPRRTASVTVLLISETPDETTGRATIAPLVDRALSLLDQHIDGRAKWETESDSAIDIGENISCMVIEFSILDN
jgi:hypothetical protein